MGIILKDGGSYHPLQSDARPCAGQDIASPFPKPMPEDRAHFAGKLAASFLPGRRVMVVDNQPAIRKTVSVMLELMGYTVFQADDSQLASWYFAKESVDLVIADFDLAPINGYDLACKLKKRSLGTKVVIMTVRCQAEVVEQMATGDIDGWLFKPFRIRELSAMLDFVGLATPARFPAKGGVIAGMR